MKILLDENVAAPLTNALRAFLFAHEIHHAAEAGWSGTPDIELFKRAAQEGFAALVTTDGMQMKRPAEVAALAESGIHRIEFNQRHKGLTGLAMAIGAVCAGLPLALVELELAPSQRLVQLRGIDPTPKARIAIVDPMESPPKFWPA